MSSLVARLRDRQGPCVVVADLTGQHDGSPATALALVEAAARAGADAVSFESYRTATLTARRGPGVRPIDVHRALERAELPLPGHGAVRDHARRYGLACFVTPRDATRTTLVASLGVPGLGVARDDLTERTLLERIGACGRLVVLAVEGASSAEIEQALAALACGAGAPERRPPVALLAGGTLAQLDRLAAQGETVGWRHTTADDALAIAAVARGARCVTQRLALEEGRPAVAGPAGFARLVRAIRDVERALEGPALRGMGARLGGVATRAVRSGVVTRSGTEGR